jgi:nucleoside 2-deoxyribosyltransferase
LFKALYLDDFFKFANEFKAIADRLILKENRGGSRAFDFSSQEQLSIPSQTRPIVHSVGVGDVYNAAYVYSRSIKPLKASLTLSSWIAMEYAITTFPDDFKRGVQRTLKSNIDDLINIGGVILPWEFRKQVNIYIAAPDFDFVNGAPIELLVESLNYHNFSPRRPIKENGQMEKDASKSRKNELFTKDIDLLDNCSMLVAVLLYNDPGTLIEIGYAAAKGKPVLVYDPHNIAENCMLTELPTLISTDLDEIISEIFIINTIK